MKKSPKEQVCAFGLLYHLLGGTTFGIVAEIAQQMLPSGCSKVDWRAYRKREGLDRTDLRRILKKLEVGGLLIREPGVQTWDLVWVNPIVLRSSWANQAYFTNMVQGFYKKRHVALQERVGDKPMPEDPADDLLGMLPKPEANSVKPDPVRPESV